MNYKLIFGLGLIPPGVVAKDPGYLTFASDEAFTLAVNNTAKNWNGTLYYSTDAANWNEWDGTTAILSAEHGGGQKIYMRGSGNSRITGNDKTRHWVLTGKDIRCLGNIENLLDYETVANGKHPDMGSYCYYGLFAYNKHLISAPKLPATTLTVSCYNGMFYGCTKLALAPELPATELADSCYKEMLSNCSALVSAPELPATKMAEYCYYLMFASCTFASAPKLPATELAKNCYASMFWGCYKLVSIPALPATTLAENCYSSMLSNCSRIKLSETQTDEYTQAYRIPASGTGETASGALSSMFLSTGGTFTGTPSINTTYYLHKTNAVVG